MPEAKESIAQASKLAEQQTRKLASHKERKERVGSTYQKGRPASKTDAPEKKNLKKETRKSPSKELIDKFICQRYGFNHWEQF